MRQKWAILLDSVGLVQAQNCQGDLTLALQHNVKHISVIPSSILACFSPLDQPQTFLVITL
jgi:hypothetical protein